MRRAVFENFATRFKLQIRCIEFFGGYEPGLWDAAGQSRLIRFSIGAANRLRRWMPFLDHINHSLWSGFFIGIYQKPLDN